MLFRSTVLIALSLRNSFLTLPFGLALFFLKGAAPPAVALRDIYLGIGGPSSRRAKKHGQNATTN